MNIVKNGVRIQGYRHITIKSKWDTLHVPLIKGVMCFDAVASKKHQGERIYK